MDGVVAFYVTSCLMVSRLTYHGTTLNLTKLNHIHCLSTLAVLVSRRIFFNPACRPRAV